LKNHRAGLAVLACDIGRKRLSGAEQRMLDIKAAVEQLVVVAATGQDFVQGAQLSLALGSLDAFGSELLQQGHGSYGHDCEQAQYQGVLEHRAAEFWKDHCHSPSLKPRSALRWP